MCYSLTTQGADNEANNTVNYNLYMHYTNIVYMLHINRTVACVIHLHGYI